ncbi:hypothetical protein AcV7_008222 [Taiwanofungus camphoratus]|nr:hypothetical protein AcV7_008222 [Antrodia cinnamomea]
MRVIERASRASGLRGARSGAREHCDAPAAYSTSTVSDRSSDRGRRGPAATGPPCRCRVRTVHAYASSMHALSSVNGRIGNDVARFTGISPVGGGMWNGQAAVLAGALWAPRGAGTSASARKGRRIEGDAWAWTRGLEDCGAGVLELTSPAGVEKAVERELFGHRAMGGRGRGELCLRGCCVCLCATACAGGSAGEIFEGGRAGKARARRYSCSQSGQGGHELQARTSIARYGHHWAAHGAGDFGADPGRRDQGPWEAKDGVHPRMHPANHRTLEGCHARRNAASRQSQFGRRCDGQKGLQPK